MATKIISHRRSHHERIRVPVSQRRRGVSCRDGITGADAEEHAEMDGVDEAARRAGTYQGPGSPARARWQGGQRQEGHHRRAVRGVQGCHRRLHADRGEGPGPGGGAFVGLSHLGGGRRSGSAPGPEDRHVMELHEHLFRREAGRMVATLTRIFGVEHLALAEDVVQDAFCRALFLWKYPATPENPSAWLMATAKHRALDVLRRERTARTFAPELSRLLESEETLAPVVEELFASHAIKDDQLRMMFSCCHPRLPEAAQVALMLHILCGFSVDEIAGAFVSSHAAIEKRITRAKKVLAASKTLFDVAAGAEFSARLPCGASGALPAVQRGLPRRLARVGGPRRALP